ncbi:MAG TPA: DUF2399 domain-containing protein [Micromonosporaceae bacterium]|nr:DUF2399 domain-containing protein [Micromonosporaceae bacterium]
MDSTHYRSVNGSGPTLLGSPAATPWDPPLAETMRATGHAIMEERLLDPLLADLCRR